MGCAAALPAGLHAAARPYVCADLARHRSIDDLREFSSFFEVERTPFCAAAGARPGLT